MSRYSIVMWKNTSWNSFENEAPPFSKKGSDFRKLKTYGYRVVKSHPEIVGFHIYDSKYPKYARENLAWIGNRADFSKAPLKDLLRMLPFDEAQKRGLKSHETGKRVKRDPSASHRNVHWFVSRLGPGKPKMAWPVELMRTRDGFAYVRGLGGRFKGRSFSIVSSELYSYLPTDARVPPDGKQYVPESAHVGLALRKKLAAANPSKITDKTAAKLMSETVALHRVWWTRSSNDLAWQYYDESMERAKRAREDRRYDSFLRALISALDMIRGAAERSK